MTKNVLKNLFTKSATRLYPFVKRDIFEEVRGTLHIEINKCIFCRACELRCPTRCITVDSKAGIWSFDPMACVICGVCVAVCPTKCLYTDKQYREPLLARGISAAPLINFWYPVDHLDLAKVIHDIGMPGDHQGIVFKLHLELGHPLPIPGVIEHHAFDHAGPPLEAGRFCQITAVAGGIKRSGAQPRQPQQ